jgi:hypothetical protein
MPPIHTDKVYCAVSGILCAQKECRSEELDEFLGAKFTGSALKFPMFDAATTTSVAMDPDVVRRVQKSHLSTFTPQKLCKGARVASITYKQSMAPKLE